MNTLNAISSTKIDEFIFENKKPVVVFFWAAWCGPCLMMRPVIKEIIAENNPAFDIFSVDVDDNPDLAQRFGIEKIPYFQIFRDGETLTAIKGAVGKQKLLQEISEALTD